MNGISRIIYDVQTPWMIVDDVAINLREAIEQVCASSQLLHLLQTWRYIVLIATRHIRAHQPLTNFISTADVRPKLQTSFMFSSFRST